VCGLDLSGSHYFPVVGSCDHSNEPLDSMTGETSGREITASSKRLWSMVLVIDMNR
jgi:hypothetical protein